MEEKQEQRTESTKYRPENYFNEWMAEARLFRRLGPNLSDESGQKLYFSMDHFSKFAIYLWGVLVYTIAIRGVVFISSTRITALIMFLGILVWLGGALYMGLKVIEHSTKITSLVYS